MLDLLLLSGALGNPGPRFSPRLVEGKEAALSSSLDAGSRVSKPRAPVFFPRATLRGRPPQALKLYSQHVGLGYESSTGLKEPRVGDLGLVENVLNLGILGEVQSRQPGGRVVLGRGGKRAGLDGFGAGEVVVEDGLAVGLENRLGGHGDCGESCTVGAVVLGESFRWLRALSNSFPDRQH